MFRRSTFLSVCLVSALVAPVAVRAQEAGDLVRQTNRSGPRFGFTWMGGSIADTVSARLNQRVAPVVTQFGWQIERQFASLEGGPVALNDWILLVGGLDQGVFLPSLTWLVGIRTPGGFEFGIGPNANPAGVALALSVGQTFRAGALAVPVNLAYVPSRFGPRISLLTGFNMYR